MQSVIAIVAGYLVFGVSSAILFRVGGQDPHLLPTPGFLLCSVAYGTAFAAAGGYLAARLAPRRPLTHAAILAALLAAGALAAIALERSAGSIWSQLLVLVVMTPAALGGGYLRVR
jgi:hypothetical protein